MNVWRLIPYHVREKQKEMAEWSRRSGIIAIGWGGMGDLSQQHFHNEAELKQITKNTHPGFSVNSWVHGGCSLWRFYHEMQIGDLVIISAESKRVLTMRVTGDYFFDGAGVINDYPHRRKAEEVPIDANRLWQVSGGMALGENIRSTFIRCAQSLTKEEYKALPALESVLKPDAADTLNSRGEHISEIERKLRRLEEKIRET